MAFQEGQYNFRFDYTNGKDQGSYSWLVHISEAIREVPMRNSFPLSVLHELSFGYPETTLEGIALVSKENAVISILAESPTTRQPVLFILPRDIDAPDFRGLYSGKSFSMQSGAISQGTSANKVLASTLFVLCYREKYPATGKATMRIS